MILSHEPLRDPIAFEFSLTTQYYFSLWSENQVTQPLYRSNIGNGLGSTWPAIRSCVTSGQPSSGTFHSPTMLWLGFNFPQVPKVKRPFWSDLPSLAYGTTQGSVLAFIFRNWRASHLVKMRKKIPQDDKGGYRSVERWLDPTWVSLHSTVKFSIRHSSHCVCLSRNG